MEVENDKYFTNIYTHRQLHYEFVKSNRQNYRNSKEFHELFEEMFKVKLSSNKNHHDYKRKLEQEKDKFNGRVSVGEGAETASNLTSNTKVTKKSGTSILTKGDLSKGSSPERPGSVRPDDIDDAAGMARDGSFEPDPAKAQANALDEEDELAEQERLEEEKRLADEGKST